MILFSLLLFPLSAEEVRFEDLGKEALKGKEVELRGFLYRTKDGEAVLASKPNLRTCCAKKEEHVTLLGFPADLSSTRAILIKGILSQDGKSIENADAVMENEPAMLLCSLALLGGTTLLYLLLRPKSLKRPRSPS